MKIRKIYVVAALHGDEPFGLKILANLMYIDEKRVVSKVGHPEAVAKRREFLEANLNRCFASDAPPSKERQIAKFITSNIAYHKPDLILDVHTCECHVGKSAIIPSRNMNLINVAKLLGMDYVFEGVPDMTHKALLGQNPGKTMVIELGKGYRSDALAESLAQRIVGLLDTDLRAADALPIMFYSKSRYLRVKECKGLELKNYTYNKKLKGYPYLVGQNTYEKYLGYVGFISAKEEAL